MFKNLVAFFGLSLVVSLSAVAAHASAKGFPATMAEFDKYTLADMKALPDVKWPLNKTATAADVKGKSEVEIALMRNSLFAQNGMRFTQPGLGLYFATRSWYKPSETVGALTTTANASAHVFLQAQAHADGRHVADEGSDDDYHRPITEETSYAVFMKMGFCTYSNANEVKAGLIVFDTNGNARVYHSVASGTVDEADAYTATAVQAGAPDKTRLLNARWSVEETKEGARVLVTFTASAIPRDWGGNPMIKAGAREVLKVKAMAKSGDWEKNEVKYSKQFTDHTCTMIEQH